MSVTDVELSMGMSGDFEQAVRPRCLAAVTGPGDAKDADVHVFRFDTECVCLCRWKWAAPTSVWAAQFLERESTRSDHCVLCI